MIPTFNLISFTVYGNPVPAQRARVMRGGWSFTPKRTIEAEEAVAAAWKAAAQGRWCHGLVNAIERCHADLGQHGEVVRDESRGGA